tara:strand:- start:725 stop:1423 length:699 start_codon:yes stop_codon:yes gene_type:complete
MLSLFLISCQTALEEVRDQIEDVGAESEEIQNDIDKAVAEDEEASNKIDELLPGKCKPQWKCISSKSRAYQDENCEFSKKTKCDHYCENNECYIPPAKVCTAGFKCVNNFTRGYQLESCKFQDKKDCEWRCENNKCVPKPENYTEPEVVEEAPVIPKSFPSINMGEEIEVNGHTFKINLLESDQVKLAIDGKGSNWLKEGESFTVYGLTIKVKAIYFQAYQGGIQKIDYEVS